MNKLLIIYQISPLNLILIILFRVIGYRVNYFNITKILKIKFVINFLHLLGIHRVDYNKIKIKNGLIFDELIKSNYKISKFISMSLWSNHLKKIFLSFNNFNLCVVDESLNRLKITNELISYKNFIYKKKKPKSLLIVAEFNLQNYSYFKNYSEKNNLKVIYLLNLVNICFIFFKFFKFFFKSILSSLKITNNSKIENIKNNEKFFENKVLFFPNHGVFNTRVDKRYYYSKKYKNLNPEKILHVELLNSHLKFLTPSVLKFYRKNSIKNICWENLEKKISKDLILKTITLCFRNTKKLNLLNFLFFFMIIYKLNYHLKILNRFKKVKVILVGQADLFPNTISVASRINKIKTISFQNRLVNPTFLLKMKCIDNYFCIGKNSIKNLSHRYDKKMKLGKIFPILNRDEKILPKQSLKLKRCLILPYSINSDWFLQGREIVSNSNNIEEFLNKIILIIKKEKKIEFIIKFKSDSFKFNGKINNLVKKLKMFKNAKVKHGFILQHKELVNFDLVIGQPTSLIESCIFLSISSLIYEKNESYKELIICDDDKIFCNYENILSKFDLHKKNLIYYKKNINDVKKKLFFKYDPEKIEKIKEQINRIAK
tara:strand:+ start:393 stop:2195 length:1803 start_codon:yes stop_codon:yes gene_type:complete